MDAQRAVDRKRLGATRAMSQPPSEGVERAAGNDLRLRPRRRES
jgi:hypothetical protein